jgi:CheY-like chemotaxis protein
MADVSPVIETVKDLNKMTSPTDFLERRRHPRSEVVASATVLAASGYAGSFLVENLSAGGALLTGDPRVELGERVTMLLHLPSRQPIRLTAEIIRREVRESQERAYAVAFRQISPADEDAIQDLVLHTLERLHDESKPIVLVVDDILEARHALERDLRALGRRAVSVATPLEAVDQLSHTDRRIDTALVDLRLGHADGLELMAFLADSHPDIRRVLMSGCVQPWQLDLAITSGRAHAVLDKPWSRLALAKAISG